MAMTLGAAKVEQADSSASNSQTYTLTTGRGVIALIIFQTSGVESITSVTVSGESNMTLLGTPSVPSSTWTTQIAYLGTVTSGGSKTIAVNFSGALASYVFLQELHDGSNGGIAVDGVGNASATGTNPTVNVTTGSANSAIFAVLEARSADPTPGASYTQLSETSWYSYEAAIYDLDAGAAGTYAANWTSASQEYSIAAAGFKAAGGGGGGRTTKNTRAFPLGVNVGMNWRS